MCQCCNDFHGVAETLPGAQERRAVSVVREADSSRSAPPQRLLLVGLSKNRDGLTLPAKMPRKRTCGKTNSGLRLGNTYINPCCKSGPDAVSTRCGQKGSVETNLKNALLEAAELEISTCPPIFLYSERAPVPSGSRKRGMKRHAPTWLDVSFRYRRCHIVNVFSPYISFAGKSDDSPTTKP